MLAPNYTGNSGATLTNLDPSLVVPADFKMDGTKNPAGFLLDQIVEAKRMLEENYAWDEASGDTLCLAISSTMKAQMIMWEEQKNKITVFRAGTRQGESNAECPIPGHEYASV